MSFSRRNLLHAVRILQLSILSECEPTKNWGSFDYAMSGKIYDSKIHTQTSIP